MLCICVVHKRFPTYMGECAEPLHRVYRCRGVATEKTY